MSTTRGPRPRAGPSPRLARAHRPSPVRAASVGPRL